MDELSSDKSSACTNLLLKISIIKGFYFLLEFVWIKSLVKEQNSRSRLATRLVCDMVYGNMVLKAFFIHSKDMTLH